MITTIHRTVARRRAQVEAGEQERGFTLIELMVVIIIIGILAAIAIPAFLSQRQGAWDTQVKSDLGNAAIAANAYAAGNNGSYAGTPAMSIGLLISTYGLKNTPGVNLTLVSTTANTFVITGYNSNSGATGHTWTYATTNLSGPS